MHKNLFKLVSTCELFICLDGTDRPVRIEIFRARVWLQNTYDVHPTFVNNGGNAEFDTIYSSDQIDMEITSLIAESPTLMTGQRYLSEDAFLTYLINRVEWYERKANSGAPPLCQDSCVCIDSQK